MSTSSVFFSGAEMALLRQAHGSVSLRESRFWEKVGAKVGRSAEDCQRQWFQSFAPKSTLAAKDEKKKSVKARQRLEKAEEAITEAARAATTFEDTSAGDAGAAKKARLKLRRALKSLRDANDSLPTKEETGGFFDESLKLMALPPSPTRSSESRSEARDSDDEKKDEQIWRPAQGYLAALKKKRKRKEIVKKLPQKDSNDLRALKHLQRQLDDANNDAEDDQGGLLWRDDAA